MNGIVTINNYINTTIEYQMSQKKLDSSKKKLIYVKEELKRKDGTYMRIKVCIFEDEVRKNQERLERLAVLKFKADRQYSSLMESLTSEELSSLREEITHEESVTKDYLEVMRTTKKELGSLKHASDFLSEKYKLDEKTLKEIKMTIQTEISKLEMKADFYKNIVSAIDSHLEDNRKKKLERQQ